MVDTVNVSLIDTFSIEEEKSVLNIFSTPVNFKKLMEKQPAIHPYKDVLDGICESPSVNNSFKSKENYNALNSTKYDFISPLASGQESRCLKSKFSAIGISEMSPICKTDQKYSRSMQIGNVCCQTTPNQKENSKINYSQFNLSKRTENESIGFVKPDREINLKCSPNSIFMRNLVAAEKKILLEEKLKEKENEDVDLKEVTKSLDGKLRKYALENVKGDDKASSTNEMIEKQPREMIPVKMQDSTSPDIQAIFLARNARIIQEEQKSQNKGEYSPSNRIAVRAALENKIRAYGEFLKQLSNSIKQRKRNTNSSYKSQLTSATVNKKKSEFVTPLTSSVRTKKIVPARPRWK